MLIFAFDTSLSKCSAAIVDGGLTRWARSKSITGGQAEELPRMTAEALLATAIDLHEFDLIGVTVGPGTFAGVRVGIAFARGLTLGVKARPVGVSTLTALAAGVAPEDDCLIAPIIDARRGQVYASLLSAELNVILPPFVATPDQCRERLDSVARGKRVSIIGPGAHLVCPYQSDAQHSAIDPVTVARLVVKAGFTAAAPTPVYLRPPDAKPSLQQNSIRRG